jgi:hypothetical protein
MAIWSALGILLLGLMRHQQIRRTRAVDRAAAASAAFHTIPTDPTAHEATPTGPKVAV